MAAKADHSGHATRQLESSLAVKPKYGRDIFHAELLPEYSGILLNFPFVALDSTVHKLCHQPGGVSHRKHHFEGGHATEALEIVGSAEQSTDTLSTKTRAKEYADCVLEVVLLDPHCIPSGTFSQPCLATALFWLPAPSSDLPSILYSSGFRQFHVSEELGRLPVLFWHRNAAKLLDARAKDYLHRKHRPRSRGPRNRRTKSRKHDAKSPDNWEIPGRPVRDTGNAISPGKQDHRHTDCPGSLGKVLLIQKSIPARLDLPKFALDESLPTVRRLDFGSQPAVASFVAAPCSEPGHSHLFRSASTPPILDRRHASASSNSPSQFGTHLRSLTHFAFPKEVPNYQHTTSHSGEWNGQPSRGRSSASQAWSGDGQYGGDTQQRTGNFPDPQLHSRQQTSRNTDGAQHRPYPCVYHEWDGGAGDPTPHCDSFEAYVSRLAPHHRRRHPNRHPTRFLYCTKCFRADFEHEQEVEHHKVHGPCQFLCVTEDCRNYALYPPYVNPCDHGLENSQRCKWRKLYRLARGLGPYDPAPDPDLPNGGIRRAIPPTYPEDPARYVNDPSLTHRSAFSPSWSPIEQPNPDTLMRDQSRTVQDHLRFVAATIWSSVNCAIPQWDPISASHELYRAICESENGQPPGGLENFDQRTRMEIGLLRTLLHRYNRVITDPSSRDQRTWVAVAELTQQMLPGRVRIPSSMPWRSVPSSFLSSSQTSSNRQQQFTIPYRPQQATPRPFNPQLYPSNASAATARAPSINHPMSASQQQRYWNQPFPGLSNVPTPFPQHATPNPQPPQTPLNVSTLFSTPSYIPPSTHQSYSNDASETISNYSDNPAPSTPYDRILWQQRVRLVQQQAQQAQQAQQPQQIQQIQQAPPIQRFQQAQPQINTAAAAAGLFPYRNGQYLSPTAPFPRTHTRTYTSSSSYSDPVYGTQSTGSARWSGQGGQSGGRCEELELGQDEDEEKEEEEGDGEELYE